MGAPGLTTGLRSETFKKLQLNAGIVLKDFDYSAITTASALKTAVAAAKTAGNMLGATRGGGTFTATRETRSPEVDGKRYNYKGGMFVDSIDAYLSTTLLEITPDNLVTALGTGEATTSGAKTTIKMHTAIDDDDYIENICWIGDTAEEGFVIIALLNAINMADFSLTYADKNEGTLPVELHATQDEVDDYDYAPFEIVHFAPAT